MIITPNQKAFLHMIKVSELGYDLIKASDDGYNVIVGSTVTNVHLFKSYADHPRILVRLGNGTYSTAAGAYQLLARYYDAYKKLLRLSDFGKESQDLIALQQIRERRALADIEAGRLVSAVNRVKNIWASLPGAGYGQHENEIADLEHYYGEAGGTFV